MKIPQAVKSFLWIIYAVIGFASGCVFMYFLFRPISKFNAEILKNREVSYSILMAQDSINSRMDLADMQIDSIREEIKENRLNISIYLKKARKDR